MRVADWNPQQHDAAILEASMERLRKAAELVADRARAKCPAGTLSRPIYKKGPYAGKPWTARDAGALRKTIRVVEKHERYGTEVGRFRNVRVYAGNYLVYYASIVEYAGKKFLRPALEGARAQIRTILENG